MGGEESLGRHPAERELDQFPGFAHGTGKPALIGIHDLAIGADDGGDIFGGFHPPFDLERFNSGGHHLRDKVDAGKVIGGEVVSFLAAIFVLAAARLGAAAAVAAVAAEE